MPYKIYKNKEGQLKININQTDYFIHSDEHIKDLYSKVMIGYIKVDTSVRDNILSKLRELLEEEI